LATHRSAIPDRPDPQHDRPYGTSQAPAATTKSLDAGLQGRIDDRREARVVVGRDLVEPACLLGFRVTIGVGATDEPEHGGRVPLGAEGPEILARRRRSGLTHPLCGKMPAERVEDAPARRGIVDHQRIAVERRDLRRSGGARGRGLGLDDPLDRGEHAPAHPLVEAAHIELDDGLVGDDVLLGAGLQGADRDNGGLRGGELAGDDGLQAHDC
jgi:hypothetical protein